ncbi:M48 family metallopeptidase [Bermanella marisrubri]|uniref:Peptidase M48, Ste24p n=1 Tax=Bermanella marisrubri TaxID=207949 RepID=Q1N1C9_9GAMM|nr:M48 family metallopeptidase [Bermanella marisrubri]EAT12121.1 Peptidase M48, Ste24p [Oceanobacter sp. RED65] [Bermanella marisrubri]QIZ83584.1 M48 family metallopeptidase [Bermanella marisrubri]
MSERQFTIEGEFFSGECSKGIPARLVAHSNTSDSEHHFFIQIEEVSKDGSILKRHQYRSHQLTFESPLGDTPREISIDEGSLFVSSALSEMDSLRSSISKSKHNNILHKLESNSSMIFASIIFTMLFCWGFFIYGIPAIANAAAHQLPIDSLEEGDSALYVLDTTLFTPSQLTNTKQEEIKQLLTPYLEQYADQELKIHFRRFTSDKSSDGELESIANAFALPDGNIVFTDGLIEIIEHDHELLAIAFHELGHLQHKHILRRSIQGAVTWVILLLMTGDLESAELIAGLPVLLLDLQYSRDFEIEADQYAISALKDQGISPQYFADIMKRLAGDESNPENKWSKYFSTHPMTQERIKLAQ